MPKPHVGALSRVAYTIPELDDVGDVEVAFSEFADTIPPAPAAIKTTTTTADVPLAEVNALYVFDGTGPNTLTLPQGVHDGDKIQVLQLQAGAITVQKGQLTYQGPNATNGEFSALTMLWQATEQRWVGSPFFSSGVLPPESQGGDDTIVVGGLRYHIFRYTGSFYPHRSMLVNAFVVGAGGEGAAAGTLPGDGGSPGHPVMQTALHVDAMQAYPVVVGGTVARAGEPSSFKGVTAAGGAAGVVDTISPVDAPLPLLPHLPPEVIALLGADLFGGTGPKDAGPILPTQYGQGGAGAHKMLAQTDRPSRVVVVPGSPGSPGSPGTPDQRICTGANPVYGTRPVQGANQTPYCPATWGYRHTDCSGVWCGHADGRFERNGWLGGCPGGWWGCNCGACCTNETYQTGWNCDGRPGSLDGSQCCYTQPGSPGSPGSPGTPDTSYTQWDPCPSGYVVGTDTTKCVDARPAGFGLGGDGLVVIWYVIPSA
jgi:hypothetical protein